MQPDRCKTIRAANALTSFSIKHEGQSTIQRERVGFQITRLKQTDLGRKKRVKNPPRAANIRTLLGPLSSMFSIAPCCNTPGTNEPNQY